MRPFYWFMVGLDKYTNTCLSVVESDYSILRLYIAYYSKYYHKLAQFLTWTVESVLSKTALFENCRLHNLYKMSVRCHELKQRLFEMKIHVPDTLL